MGKNKGYKLTPDFQKRFNDYLDMRKTLEGMKAKGLVIEDKPDHWKLTKEGLKKGLNKE